MGLPPHDPAQTNRRQVDEKSLFGSHSGAYAAVRPPSIKIPSALVRTELGDEEPEEKEAT